MKRWGWQTKEAESKAWNKESLEYRKPGSEEEQGRSRRRMENKHLFFPSPTAHEGFLWVFPLAVPSLPPPSVPGSWSTLSSRALCLWHQGPGLFLRQIPKFAVGLSLAQPQHKPNSSFLPSTLQEL